MKFTITSFLLFNFIMRCNNDKINIDDDIDEYYH